MNAKHTQGSWQVLHDASVVGPDEVQEDGSIHVQSIARMALCQELMANARLIAAAPELLDAANAALDAMTDERADDEYKKMAVSLLRSAIAKATGA